MAIPLPCQVAATIVRDFRVLCSHQLVALNSILDDLKTSSPVSKSSIAAPTWVFSNDSSRMPGQQAQCEITFDVPYDLSMSF